MNYKQAKEKVIKFRVFGLVLLIPSIATFVVSLLKSLYIFGKTNDDIIGLGRAISNLIANIYHTDYFPKSLWNISPYVKFEDPFSLDNINFFVIYMVLIVSVSLLRNASVLSHKLSKIDEDINIEQIKQSRLGNYDFKVEDTKNIAKLPETTQSFFNSLLKSILIYLVAPLVVGIILIYLNKIL
ncbi:YniB family protein [Morganella morganii]|uniref:YniB family protein n=1 Tax=Morganella morganii TaxID=582 RepID=UPI0013C66747|nr:YniB family protein [Morganella morganii]NGE95480.1 hypothetical protein [Morganella morganii]